MALTFFFAACGLLVAGALLLLMPALLPRAAATPGATDAGRVAVGQDQLRELDDDVAFGALPAPQRTRAAEEIVRRLLADAGDSIASPARVPRWPWLEPMSLALLLPLACAALYFVLGRPGSIDPLAPHALAQTAEHAVDAESLARQIGVLHARLQARPADADGWLALARAYGAIGRYRDAALAYTKLAQHRPPDAGTLADHADFAAMAQGRRFAGEPARLIAQALERDAKHPKALVLAASAASEAGDVDGARHFWSRALAVAQPGSGLAQSAQRALAVLAPSGAALADAGAITGVVRVAPNLAPRIQAGDTLFVFARTIDGARMPLAIQRVGVERFPAAFRLDDASAMAAARRLSSQREVTLGARISRSGSANGAAGDLVGTAGVVAVGTSDVVIVVDRVED